jgi:hypothetical protein
MSEAWAGPPDGGPRAARRPGGQPSKSDTRPPRPGARRVHLSTEEPRLYGFLAEKQLKVHQTRQPGGKFPHSSLRFDAVDLLPQNGSFPVLSRPARRQRAHHLEVDEREPRRRVGPPPACPAVCPRTSWCRCYKVKLSSSVARSDVLEPFAQLSHKESHALSLTFLTAGLRNPLPGHHFRPSPLEGVSLLRPGAELRRRSRVHRRDRDGDGQVRHGGAGPQVSAERLLAERCANPGHQPVRVPRVIGGSRARPLLSALVA